MLRSRRPRARRRSSASRPSDRVRARPPRLRRPSAGAGASSKARCPGTTRSRSATCARRSSGSAAAVAAGARICVHGDYDADGICATALAVLLLRELGAEPAWHLPSRFEEGYGLASQTLVAARRRGRRPRADGRLRDHRRRRGRARRARLGLDVVVTDHHRPARHVPRLPGRRAAEGRRIRSPGSAAPASSGSSPRRCSAPATRSSSGTSTSSRSRPSPTSSRSSTRTARSPALGLRRLAQTQKPGLLRADARRAASIRPRATRARSASGSRRGSTPPAGSAAPRPRSSCC